MFCAYVDLNNATPMLPCDLHSIYMETEASRIFCNVTYGEESINARFATNFANLEKKLSHIDSYFSIN